MSEGTLCQAEGAHKSLTRSNCSAHTGRCGRKVPPLKLSAVLHHCPSLWDDKKCSVVNKLITDIDGVPDGARATQVTCSI